MLVNADLLKLRESFQKRDRDLRFVGGCVRDDLLGKTPKDIDICTDATPDEQETIYAEDGIRHIATGVQHGTWTVVINDNTYEITSLRTETDHDGRHATMSWTRDWTEDLSRRDLTINAMARSFDGVLFDPFGGEADLENKRVRFVGNAKERMKEDYLRILRFFRFHARITVGVEEHGYNREAIEAARECSPGLANISRERVWSEMSRIVSGPMGYTMIRDLISFDIAPYIDLPYKDRMIHLVTAHANTRDPASLMAAWLGDRDSVEDLAKKWKWSSEERKQALYIVTQPSLTLKKAKMNVAVDGDKKYWVAETLCVQNNKEAAEELLEWSVPKFPVTGDDLLDLGHAPCVGLKNVLNDLRTMWGMSNYRMTKEELLAK